MVNFILFTSHVKKKKKKLPQRDYNIYSLSGGLALPRIWHQRARGGGKKKKKKAQVIASLLSFKKLKYQPVHHNNHSYSSLL